MNRSIRTTAVTTPPQAVAGAALHDDKARVATRVGSDYVLRSIVLLSEMVDGELLSGLVWVAIVQANIGHIDRLGVGRDFQDHQSPPPDSVRRPVSVLALSAGLRLPYETTRRHVSKLVASGLCARVRGGVIVPAAVLSTDKHAELLDRNLINLRRLSRDLKAAGVRLD
jgi:hypothetical protein